jgi:integrase
MNDYKDPNTRRQITQHLLDEAIVEFKAGYNLVTGKYIEAGELAELNEFTPLNRAFQLAYNRLSCAPNTKADIKSMLYWIPIASLQLGFANLPVSEIKMRHVRLILDQCATIRSRIDPETGDTISTKEWSNHKFNRYRSYLMMLFKVMKGVQAIEQNPCNDIDVKKKTKKKRQTLTKKEEKIVDAKLRELAYLSRNSRTREEAYSLWRIIHIFHASGGRETEIMELKRRHVDLESQTFVRLIKKGPAYEEIDGTIKDIVVDLWREIINEPRKDGIVDPEDYLFSEGLRPGLLPIGFRQLGRRWKRWVKKQLDITADFYSLKHSNTGKTAAIAGDQAAADHNGQKSTAMVIQFYDTDRAARKHEELKKVNNPFA